MISFILRFEPTKDTSRITNLSSSLSHPPAQSLSQALHSSEADHILCILCVVKNNEKRIVILNRFTPIVNRYTLVSQPFIFLWHCYNVAGGRADWPCPLSGLYDDTDNPEEASATSVMPSDVLGTLPYGEVYPCVESDSVPLGVSGDSLTTFQDFWNVTFSVYFSCKLLSDRSQIF